MSETSLLSIRALQSSASIRLFCIPYAGGSASVYRPWTVSTPSWLDIVPIELPGRGRLVKEPLASSLPELAARIARAIESAAEKPYAIFGHSLGALLAYQAAAILAESAVSQPRFVYLSGVTPPFLERERPRLSDMEESTLLEHLRAFEGTPEALLNDPSIRAFLLPILRSDFRLVEQFRLAEPLLVQSPLTVLQGKEDPATPEQEMVQWKRAAGGEFTFRSYAGGHFFLTEPAVIGDIVRDLEALGPETIKANEE